MKNANHQVLLVEDDEKLAALVRAYLQKHEFEVEIDSEGSQALCQRKGAHYDLIILDLMLPKLSGIDICRQLRESFAGPIVIVTAKDSDIDQIIGLDAGADDYIAKPIEPMVLLARLRSLLRRVERANTNLHEHKYLEFGQLKIDKAAQSVYLGEDKVSLTSQEFDLLYLLATRSGVVLSREEIFRQLRGFDYDGLDRTVDVRISRIRKKLGDNTIDPEKIKTIWGKGYLFVTDAW